MYDPFVTTEGPSENPWDRVDMERNWSTPENEYYVPSDEELFSEVDDLSEDALKPPKRPDDEIIVEEPEVEEEDECPTVEFPAIVPRAPSLARLLVSPADSYFQVRCRDGSVLHITGCTPAQSKAFASPTSSRIARVFGLERDHVSGPFSLVTVYGCSEPFPEFERWNITPDEVDPESITYGGVPADVVRRVIISRKGEIL